MFEINIKLCFVFEVCFTFRLLNNDGCTSPSVPRVVGGGGKASGMYEGSLNSLTGGRK